MRFLCQFSKQVNTFLSQGESLCKPKEQKLLILEAPFVEEISGMVITKMLDAKEQKNLTMKLKFIRNRAMFKVTSNTHKTVILTQNKCLAL